MCQTLVGTERAPSFARKAARASRRPMNKYYGRNRTSPLSGWRRPPAPPASPGPWTLAAAQDMVLPSGAAAPGRDW